MESFLPGSPETDLGCGFVGRGGGASGVLEVTGLRPGAFLAFM